VSRNAASNQIRGRHCAGGAAVLQR